MLDKSADGKAATLFLTYRIRDKTCVFVHIAKPKSSKPNKVTTQVTQRNKVAASTQSARVPQRRIILSNNIVSTPFDGSQCSVCLNNKRMKKCQECGCSKCYFKTGDPLMSFYS
jgi:hypothetical protein